jgi:hypothetical protein
MRSLRAFARLKIYTQALYDKSSKGAKLVAVQQFLKFKTDRIYYCFSFLAMNQMK